MRVITAITLDFYLFISLRIERATNGKEWHRISAQARPKGKKQKKENTNTWKWLELIHSYLMHLPTKKIKRLAHDVAFPVPYINFNELLDAYVHCTLYSTQSSSIIFLTFMHRKMENALYFTESVERFLYSLFLYLFVVGVTFSVCVLIVVSIQLKCLCARHETWIRIVIFFLLFFLIIF